MSSMPSSSPPTVTGSVLLPPPASKSSTSRASKRAPLILIVQSPNLILSQGQSSTSSSPPTLTSVRRAVNPSVSPSPGPPMARPSSPVTPTTRSAPGALCRELKCFDVSTVLVKDVVGGETGLKLKSYVAVLHKTILTWLLLHVSSHTPTRITTSRGDARMGDARMESVRRSAGYNRRFVQPKKKDSFRRFFSCQKDKCSNHLLPHECMIVYEPTLCYAQHNLV